MLRSIISAPPSVANADIALLASKTMWSCTQIDIPPLLLAPAALEPWFEIMLGLLLQPLPEGGPDDAEVKDVNSGGWSTAGCDSEALDDLALVKQLDPEPYRALQAAQQRFIEAAAAREAEEQ